MIASLFDRLTACAFWNLREADVSLEMLSSKKTTPEDKEYYLRRHKRLKKQGEDLLVEASFTKNWLVE